MEVTFATGELGSVAGGLSVAFCTMGEPGPAALFCRLPPALAPLGCLAEQEQFRGQEREALLFHPLHGGDGSRLLLVGLGRPTQLGPAAYRMGAGVAAQAALRCRQTTLALHLPDVAEEERPALVQLLVEGVRLGAYRFDRYKREPGPGQPERLVFVLPAASSPTAQAELRQRAAWGQARAEAVLLARELVNLPPAVLTPRALADQACQLGQAVGLTVQVHSARECAALGLGCLLGVGRGSAARPCLIRLTYHPETPPVDRRDASPADRPTRLALIGKGVTFDSGGLNLKPGTGLAEMKSDMAGAAAVLAAMSLVPTLRPPGEVTALLPVVENMPSGQAYRPGDILRAVDGTTVEVVNTDAEGRLILADAIALAVRGGATELIELSTLTGACLVALGPHHAGLMCDDEALTTRILAAAGAAGEQVWRLPLVPELERELDSDVADLKNLGGKHGGAIQGGLFLRRFARETPFAHLDIAGPAWAEKESPLSPKGGTGFGVLTLAEYLARAC